MASHRASARNTIGCAWSSGSDGIVARVNLAPSTNTILKFDGAGHFEAGSYAGRNFHFGIREHGMTAIANGMALSGLRPYGATFFVFSDYLRPSMRLAALMGVPTILVFTHDSIGVGEDGPTHQPVEQLAAAGPYPAWSSFVPATPTRRPRRGGPALTLKTGRPR